MGKLMLLQCFILSVFPADATENRRHIHVVRRGSKKSHRGDTWRIYGLRRTDRKNFQLSKENCRYFFAEKSPLAFSIG